MMRARFDIPADAPLYLDGNSLGRPPREVLEAVEALGRDWQERLVTGWADWIELPERVGDRLARVVLGAQAGEVIACDSVTVNLYKLASAVIAERPGAVVADAGDFPTDRYVLQGLGRELRMMDGISADAVAEACLGGAALVCLSHVNYRSGELADMAAVGAAAHDAGALVLWDVSHSVGAVPVELGATGADLAVGCTYKYLNAGPGAPAFLYVRAEHHGLRSPIQGWFGQRDQFAMGPDYDPDPGIRRFLAGTPPIAGLVAVDAALGLFEEAGIEGVGERARELTGHFVELFDERLAPLGFELGSPRDPARRGAHVSLRHPEGWRICRALIERANVIPDFRAPDSIRFGFPPLYTSLDDVEEAAARLARLVESGEYLEQDDAPRRVT